MRQTDARRVDRRTLMTMDYRLAVFDMDGTVLNTVDDLAAACNHALAECGLPGHEAAAYKRFAGSGISMLIRRALPPEHRQDEALAARIHTLFDDYYELHGQELTRPYPGIPELLTALRNAGLHVAVLSNKTQRYVPVMAESYFPGLFELALGQRDGVPVKPDPQSLLEIIQHFHLSPEQCVYIGDSDIDMQTAKAAGIVGIGVSWGFRTKQELIESGASCVIDDSDALLKILIDKSELVSYTVT